MRWPGASEERMQSVREDRNATVCKLIADDGVGKQTEQNLALADHVLACAHADSFLLPQVVLALWEMICADNPLQGALTEKESQGASMNGKKRARKTVIRCTHATGRVRQRTLAWHPSSSSTLKPVTSLTAFWARLKSCRACASAEPCRTQRMESRTVVRRARSPFEAYIARMRPIQAS